MVTLNEQEARALAAFIDQHYSLWRAGVDDFLDDGEREDLEEKLEEAR